MMLTQLLTSAALMACLLVCVPASAQDFSRPDTQPDPSAVPIKKANDAVAAGDLSSALKLLTSLNTQTPHNPQILYDLGLTLEGLAAVNPGASESKIDILHPATATATPLTPESCYRAAIAADAAFALPHVALGLLLARTDRAAEARTELLGATTLPDADPALKARALRALARLDQTSAPPNLSAASDELLSALKLTPEQPADILLSAEIAEAATPADLPAAEQAYRRFLALPGKDADPQAITGLAHILIAENHLADAESLLVPALAGNPGNAVMTALLTRIWLNSGDAAKIAHAAPLAESVHAKNPEDVAIARLLARIYLETGHLDQADLLYASLIATQANSPDPTLLDSRAEVLLRLHRPSEAEKLLRQAVANPAAFPSPAAFADAATHLAFAAEEIDDPRMTLQALALRATVQHPSPSSLYLEATANDELHHSTQAVELYKQFLAAAHGTLPDQESQARRRLAEIEHRK